VGIDDLAQVPVPRAGESDGSDDAVVIELVAQDGGAGREEGRQDAHHRRIGRAEGHGCLALVEACQSLLELDVGREGAADEAHRAGADAEPVDRILFGRDDLRPHRGRGVVVEVDPLHGFGCQGASGPGMVLRRVRMQGARRSAE